MNEISKKIIAIGILLILIFIGLFLFLNKNNPQRQQVKTVQQQGKLPDPTIITVQLTKKGFDPASITIKAGDTVKWINQSGVDASLNSADHPTHKLYPFLNQGIFGAGTAVQTKFDTKGTYSYHNHLEPTETGIVIVR